MLYVFVKLSPCAGMQSISDRRRNCSIEPREKPQIMMTSILMKAMSFFLLEILCQISFWAWRWSQLSFCWNFFFFFLCCFRTPCFKHKIKKLMQSLHWQRASGICSMTNTHWTWSGKIRRSHAILEEKRYSSNTFIETIITFETVGEEIVWEILYGIEYYQDCCYATFLVPEDYWCSWSFFLEVSSYRIKKLLYIVNTTWP